MRWLITTDGPHAHHYHRMGVARALQYCGHQVMFIDIRTESPYDAFDRHDPEIVWTQSYNLNTAMIECIKASNCHVFMRAFDNGPMKKDIEKLNENGHNIMVEFASLQEIENVAQIADRISFVCNHYVPSMFDEAMSGWQEIVSTRPNMLGFCPFTYSGGEDRPEYRSDVSFIGSYHHRKPALNDYLIQLNTLKTKDPLNIKFFSSWHWPSEYYCGVVGTSENKHVYHNANICPNISEDHSRIIGHDVIERIFAILGGGNFCLSDYVKGAEELFPDHMIFAHDREEFRKMIVHYAKNPQETRIMRESAKKEIWDKHTYFHRAAEILNNLCLFRERDNVLSVIPTVKAELCK